MNIDAFRKHFTCSRQNGNSQIDSTLLPRVDSEFAYCFSELSGAQFNGGLYRFYDGREMLRRTLQVESVFEACKGSVVVFGTDWMGRQFAVDRSELVNGKPAVGIFDFIAPDSYYTDVHILDFHNIELVDNKNAALEYERYCDWQEQSSNQLLGFDECVGYSHPLFLGGEDSLSNMKVQDLDVYIEMAIQLWLSVKDVSDE